MLERKMHGVVDLGGASTQVAVPERVAVGEKLKQSDIFVRSFLGYGMKEFYTHAPATVKEHCKFGGKASDCQDSIWSVFQSRIVDGKSYVQDKLSYFGKDDLQTIQQGDGHTDSVYSISAYYFVSQLLRSFKLLKAPPSQKISIADYNTATEALCAMSLTDVTKEYDKEETHVSGKHTTPEQLSDRCFDACYVVVLLSKLYKWSTTAPKFHFTDNVHGNSVDWPLGAYVSLITGGMGGQQQFSKPATGTSGQSTSTSGSAATTSSDEAAAASSTAITTGGRTGRGAVLPVRPESSPGVVRTRPAPIVLPPSGIIRGQSTSSSEKATEATTSSYWLRNLFAAALASGLLYFLYRKLRRNVSGDGHAQPLTRYDLEHGPDDEFGMLNDKELPTLPPERSVPGRVY
ncbi:unnamed protein product [Amoebophrya sp. A25]|nr:unnamed protein product [Amoebophrya sp. A25]|eukprot:GSA25T00024743001.1